MPRRSKKTLPSAQNPIADLLSSLTLEHWVLIGLVLTFVLRRAWIGDDPYITLRSIDNWVQGFGLTFNVSERVQAYTHPLWMLLLAAFYAVTAEPYFTTLFVCLLCTTIALVLLFGKLARPGWPSLLAGAVLLLSNAFIDWSTSGLENPLSHLLLAAFSIYYFWPEKHHGRRHLFWLSFIASLAILNRMDTGLIYAPMLALSWWRAADRKAAFWQLVAGQAPIVLWELFAILYYGFPFPNTYYAKLHTGLPAVEVYAQGWVYFVESLRFDTLTLSAVFVALLIAFSSSQRAKLVPLGIGICLYLAYIISIGGDFMSGRFFSLLIFAAAIIIARIQEASIQPGWQWVGLAAVLILGLSGPLPTYSVGDASVRELDLYNTRITNERLWYDDTMGLLNQTRITEAPFHPGRRAGEEFRRQAGPWRLVVFENAIGMEGFYAGPNVHIIDLNALSDPLLAHLPMVYDFRWRPAHYIRYELIDGYYETVLTSRNQLKDSDLRTYYDYLAQLTQGDIWSWERLRTIINMNLGKFDHLIDHFAYTYPEAIQKSYAQVNDPSPLPIDCVSARTVFGENGLLVKLPESLHNARTVTLALENDKEFDVQFLLGSQFAGDLHWAAASSPGVLYAEAFTVPPDAQSFDSVLILPLQGDPPYCLGYIQLQ